MISTAERTINVTVTSVMFPREEFEAGAPRWCKFNTDMGVCCGNVPFYPRHGMKLRLVGRYGEWHGQRQFSFKRLSHDTPQDSLALLRYVANLTKGVGDAAVEKIYTAHGDAWREHLNDGVVTPAQALAMQRTLDQLNADADRTDLIKYILGHGGTPRLANLAFEKWGPQSISIIEADPYHLAALDGIGFKTVDAMREKFGIGDGDPRRTIAAVDYTVRDLMESSGDSVCSRDALYSTVRELVKDGAGASLALAKLLKQDRLVCVGTDAYTSAEVVRWEKDLARYAIDATVLPEDGVQVAIVADGMEFGADQKAAIRAAVLSKGLVAITGGAGSGKCLGRGTPVIMYDFSIKKVEDIRVGDILLGPCGEPKHVTSVTSGREEMFRVTPKRGDAFTCNRSHILSVIHSRKRITKYTSSAKTPFNISVHDILTQLKPIHREHLKCWRPPCIMRQRRPVPLDPYFLGIWLGDGAASRCGVRISNPDTEIIDWLLAFAAKNGMNGRIYRGRANHSCPLIQITNPLGRGKTHKNLITEALAALDLHNNKHIPHIYLDNDETIRLSLLAGLLDSDGYYVKGMYEITQKSERLARDIAFLARSLGFGVTVRAVRKQCCNNGVWGSYYRMTINGDLQKIPCIVARKIAKPRRQVKNPRVSNITIEPIGDGEYFGFTLAEEDGLFLLGDFTVTHNTTIIKAIAKTLQAYGETVHLCAFAGKAAARIREATGLPASTIHSLLGSRGTSMGFGAGKFLGQTVIVDEASMVPSSLMHELTKRDPARLVLVGDVSQIQPVGIGAPFHDVVNNLSTCVHKLNTCYRNKEAVFMSANRIREGKVPEDHAKSRSEEFDVVRVRDAAEAEERIVALVREGVVDFEQDLILSPRNGEGSEPAAATVKALNARIQDIVNPHKPGQSLAVGDRVMVTKNCPPLNVWNGTTGTVTAIDGDGKPFFRADDTGETVHITMDDIRKSIVPAYCLTIHKAQGSQYRRVYAVVLARDCAALLDRSMLYTAVTRAKCACTVFTDCGLARVVNTVRERKTYFQRLVKGDTDVFA